MEYIFVGDHVTYFSFSLSFPGFFLQKIKVSQSFPPDFDNFSNSLRFQVSHVFQVCGHPVAITCTTGIS